MLKLSVAAAALALGLILASAITAAQAEEKMPHAQMNRALYPTLKVESPPRVPANPARLLASAPKPHAHMNRPLYDQ